MNVPGVFRKGNAISRKVKLPAIDMVVLIVLGVALISATLLTGCVSASSKPKIEDEVRAKVVSRLAVIKDTTLQELSAEISRIDREVSTLKLKLDKLNQVAAPALEWVQTHKAEVERAGYGGLRIVESLGYLESDKFKNDQFRVVKLQFTSEMQSAAIKYSSVIRVEDLATGKVSPLEELRSELEKRISDLTFQRNAKKQTSDLAASTADKVFSQSQSWKVVKVNQTTYNVSGPGLGMEPDLTTGVWTYYMEPERLVSSDAASDKLLKVLTGKQF